MIGEVPLIAVDDESHNSLTMPPHSMMEAGSNLLPDNASQGSQEGTEQRIKCVLVGDGAVGKTSLVVSYTTDGYPTEYTPTAFDNYSVVVTIDNSPIRVNLCDTAGQDDFDSLRPLCYADTSVFLLCFSVVNPTSFHNVTEKWVPEIRKHCPKAPIVLVGTQSDLRNDVKVLIELAHYKEVPVPESDAQALAESIGAAAYVECSSLTQIHLKEVFDTAFLAALKMIGPLKRTKSSRRSKKNKSKLDNAALTVKSPEQQNSFTKKSGWRRFCCLV